MNDLITLPTVLAGLQEIGVKVGDVLLVHTSLSSFGHVQGGPQTIIEALMAAVGPGGTIMMPAFSAGRFDPSEWRNPPVPEALWQTIRYETPLYHPQKTPTEHVGVVAELFRSWPDTRRSRHQHSSFSAWGCHRDELLREHRLEDRMGESSPLARFYDLDGSVLFLGTGFETCTCFHLAEYRRPDPPTRTFKAVVLKDGQRELIEYRDLDSDSSIFGRIGQAFEQASPVYKTTIGRATCCLFSVKEAVDFAAAWLSRRSSGDLSRPAGDTFLR